MYSQPMSEAQVFGDYLLQQTTELSFSFPAFFYGFLSLEDRSGVQHNQHTEYREHSSKNCILNSVALALVPSI